MLSIWTNLKLCPLENTYGRLHTMFTIYIDSYNCPTKFWIKSNDTFYCLCCCNARCYSSLHQGYSMETVKKNHFFLPTEKYITAWSIICSQVTLHFVLQ